MTDLIFDAALSHLLKRYYSHAASLNALVLANNLAHCRRVGGYSQQWSDVHRRRELWCTTETAILIIVAHLVMLVSIIQQIQLQLIVVVSPVDVFATDAAFFYSARKQVSGNSRH